MNDKKRYGLGDAYSLETPQDNIELYKNWAASYDSEFAQPRGYDYPQQMAQVYYSYSNERDGPILDVGAGTGLVAQELLKLADYQIDAIDISAEMLAQSKAKNLYRNHIEADLSKPLTIEDDSYGAIVSVGTFTHGHVGPKAFYELLRITRKNALFCIAINARVFDQSGFGSAFAALQAEGLISPLEFVKGSYYKNADDEHGDDIGYTAVFRKS